MSQPRVALLQSHLFRRGWPDRYTLKTADAFAARGAQVTILTSSEIQHLPKLYHAVKVSAPSHITWLHVRHFDAACREWLKDHPQDVVLGLDHNSQQTHYYAAHGVHANYLRHISANESVLRRYSHKWNPLHRMLLKFERRTFEDPELRGLYCSSHMVRAQILEHYHVKADPIRVIHEGIEWHAMSQDFERWPERKREVRLALGLDPQAFQFLFVGSDFERRGLKHLLQGLARVTPGDFQLSVVGSDSKAHHYQHLADKLGLKGRVHIFGPRRNMRSFYQMADCLALPTAYEPFSPLTAEALGMGLFVVTTERNGAHELLTTESGVLVDDRNDPQLMSEKLAFALTRLKSPASARHVRNSVKHLELKTQLETLTGHVLAATA